MLFGKHINKYYLRYGYLYIIGLLALIVCDKTQLYIPKALGSVVDMIEGSIKNGVSIDGSMITKIVINVIIVGAIIMVGRVLWRYSILYASKRIEADLRHEMFCKAERLSQRYFHSNKVGSVMAWFTNDIETMEEFFGWGFVTLVDGICLTIFVIADMIEIDLVITLIALIPVLLIIIWGGICEHVMSNKWGKRQKAFDDLYDYSQENFTGIRVIKAFVKESKEIHNFAKVAKKNSDVNIDYVKTSVIFSAIVELIIAVIMCLILGFGSYFAYNTVLGKPIVLFNHQILLDTGKLVTFVALFEKLVWPMIALGQIVPMYSRAKASLKRIAHYLDEEEEIKDCENPIMLKDIKGEITFNHFDFSYPDSKLPSLSDINLTINAGETIGIIGKIGSGKTSLVNSLLRLYNVKENSILIDGNDIMKCSIDSVRSAISYVPQDNFLFSDKIRNNIAFYDPEVSNDKIELAAKFADVHDNIVGFQNGYDTISGERGVTLSGGQKQRLSIARAYIKDAPIMIMDDSVSAVDVKTEETILANISKYRKGKTTIVIASRVSTVSHMDKILVLNEGKVEAFSNHEELLKISPTYKKMVYLQELEREVEGGGNDE